MNPAEQAALIEDLRKQQLDLNKKLEALGASPKVERELRSPDGGPPSEAHNMMRVQPRATMRVKRTGANGEEVTTTIAREHFNPEIHESLEDPEEKPKRKPRRPKVVLSEQTKDELLVMTVPALQELPEVEHIEPDELSDKKAELVEQIIAVRETFASAE